MEIIRSFTKTLHERLSHFVPLIQVVVGPRQVGKSTGVLSILKQFPNSSVYEAFDAPGPDPAQVLRFAWQRACALPGHKILALDEIQNVPDWAGIVKELYDRERNKRELSVVLLGSSALELLLRGEESLLGRFEIIRAHHWNYRECREAFGWNLRQFLQFGGYPVLGELFVDASDDTLRRCQAFVRDSIIEPVIARDIFTLRPVLNSGLLRQTLQLALSLPCEEVSFSKMLGQLSDRGNSTTMKSYLELIEKAFMIKLLYRYSRGQIRTRTSTPKIIPLAPALIHGCVSPTKVAGDAAWAGHVFEAAVISRFIETGYDLYYWSNSREDVDLVAGNGDDLYAFEIKSNQSLDWRGLKAFHKEYPHARLVAMNYDLGQEFLSASDPREFIRNLSASSISAG